MSDSFSLQINGSTINRTTSNVVLNRLHRSLDEFDVFEFTELNPIPGTWTEGSSIALFDSAGNRRFAGQITSKHYGFDKALGWQIGYTANGLKYLGNLVAVTNPQDGSGLIAYNLPPTDPRYIQSFAGLSVGTILSDLFTDHATALAAYGINSFNSSDLTSMTLVPTNPVYIQGPTFFDAIDSFLQQWYPSHACYIDPNGPLSGGVPTGVIRVVDTNAFPSNTLTLGSDPVDPASIRISRDVSQCYTRVEVRGQAWVQAAYLSVLDGTLTPSWTSTQQTDWTWQSFVAPSGSVDSGTVSSLTSTDFIATSSNSSETWSANQWSTEEAWVYLINPVVTGITMTEYRQVTANAAMTAGGTASVSWSTATPLQNSGYTLYHIIGQDPGTESDVWRRYTIVNSYIAQHLMPIFPVGVPWGTQGSVVLTNTPIGSVCWSTPGTPYFTEFPAQFEVIPADGQIRFYEPVVKYFNTQANLNTGGSAVTAPSDIKIVVPYSKGPLTAVAPGDTGGALITLTVTSGGSNYTSAPIGTVWGNGSGATVTLTISGGVVTGGTIDTPGANYTAGTLVIEGGGGTGAAITLTFSPITQVFAGNASSQDGINRTYYLDQLDWIDPRNGGDYQTIAANHLAVLQNPVVEGSVAYYGVPTAFDPLTLGYGLSIAGNGFTTGWEALDATVRGVDLEWQSQNEGTNHRLTFSLSNRRKLASGDAFYLHPAFAAKNAWDERGTPAFQGTALDPDLRFETHAAEADAAKEGGESEPLEPVSEPNFGFGRASSGAARPSPIKKRGYGYTNGQMSKFGGRGREKSNQQPARLNPGDEWMGGTMPAEQDAAQPASEPAENEISPAIADEAAADAPMGEDDLSSMSSEEAGEPEMAEFDATDDGDLETEVDE